MHNNNFYKVDNLYNAQHPWLAVPSEHGSTTAKMHTPFPKIAATIAKFQNPQQTTSNEPPVASSYGEKINQILKNWQQLQKQKKTYQEQQQQPQQSEFDQIMEEVLEHQLKELESEEKKQSILIQQVVEEQLEHEYRGNKSAKDNTEDYLEQFEELETMFLEDEQKNQPLKTDFEEFKKSQRNQRSAKVDGSSLSPSIQNKFDKISKLFHRKQRMVMELDTWKQKHDMYLKQIMDNAHQMKTNKIRHLLEICFRTKKFYLQPSK